MTELDRPITTVNPRSRVHSASGGTSYGMQSHSARSHVFSSILEEKKQETRVAKSSTLPGSGRYKPPATFSSFRPTTPPYSTPPYSPGYNVEPSSPESSNRRRAESIDAYAYVKVKNT